jgi:hypothetical protein
VTVRLIALSACAAAPLLAQAQPVFRCTDAAGKTSYQAEACEGAARQTEVRMRAPPPPDTANANRTSMWKGFKPANVAALTFYYDVKDEPVGWSTDRMEAAIRSALAAWSSQCNVMLNYGGRAPRQVPSTPDRVSIRWEPKYLGSAVAGTGGPAHGIALAPRFHEENMPRVLVHEVGHVLGLPHTHEDTESVMSYLQHDALRLKGQPSPSDYLACNQSMQRMFGVEFTPPAGQAGVEPPERRMSDREAIEKLRARQR